MCKCFLLLSLRNRFWGVQLFPARFPECGQPHQHSLPEIPSTYFSQKTWKPLTGIMTGKWLVQKIANLSFDHDNTELKSLCFPSPQTGSERDVGFWEANGLGSFFFLPIVYITYWLLILIFVFITKSIFQTAILVR